MLLDRQKEVVANYRMFVAISITILSGLIAYIFNSYEELSQIKKFITIVGFIGLLANVLYLTYQLKIETDKLKDLEWQDQ